jgi:SAM-dependent methyltransferase
LRSFQGPSAYGACVHCGSYVQRRPLLPEELRRFYSFNNYWTVHQELGGHPPIDRRADLYRLDGRLDSWLKMVERYGPPKGRVIEIGAAPGVLLQELSRRGYECIGVECDPQVAAWMRQNTGVDVRTGYFPDVELPPCDLLLGFDILEHTPEPKEFVRGVARLLVPGASAIFQTPIECRNTEKPFASRPDLFDDMAHLFLYTDRSVRKLARISSLELSAIEEDMFGLGPVCVFRKPA